jgi:hypothetical protein
MNLKTWNDTRTHEQKTGIRPDEIGTRPPVHIVTPQEQAARDKRILPEPEHHIFDIEQTTRWAKKQTPERLFMRSIIVFYYQFHTGKTFRPDDSELLKTFSVSAFCKHHEVTKADLPRLKLAAYEIPNQLLRHFEIERFRPDVLNLIETHLNSTNTRKNTPDNPLTGFNCSLTNPQLKKLCNELAKNDLFIDSETNPDHFIAAFRPEPLPDGFEKIRWTGKVSELTYFISDAMRQYINYPGQIWDKTNTLFADELGKHLKNLKQAQNGRKATYPKIDSIKKKIKQ